MKSPNTTLLAIIAVGLLSIAFGWRFPTFAILAAAIIEIWIGRSVLRKVNSIRAKKRPFYTRGGVVRFEEDPIGHKHAYWVAKGCTYWFLIIGILVTLGQLAQE